MASPRAPTAISPLPLRTYGFPHQGSLKGHTTALHFTLYTLLHTLHLTTLHTTHGTPHSTLYSTLHCFNNEYYNTHCYTALHIHCFTLHLTSLHCFALYRCKGPSERPMYDIQVTFDLGTVLHFTVLYCTSKSCTLLYYIEFFCNTLYCTAMHSTVLYCTGHLVYSRLYYSLPVLPHTVMHTL